MKVPQNTEELFEILQGTSEDEERSQVLKTFAQKIPLIVVELLLANVEVEESRNAILTTLSLFRPDIFEDYMEKNKIVLPCSLEELEETMENVQDNRARVMLLESLRQEKPDIFEAFFKKQRESVNRDWT